MRTVGVLSCVCHGEETLLRVLELEVLVWELGAINYSSSAQTQRPISFGIHTRLSTSSITLGEITSLDHEILNDTVERRPFISKVLLSSRQRSEVLNSLGHSLAIQTHHNTTHGLVAMADVEVDLVGNLGALDSLGGLGEECEGNNDDQ